MNAIHRNIAGKSARLALFPARSSLRMGFLGVDALAVPVLLFLALFYLYPLAKLILTSFDAPTISLRHYVTFFGDTVYLRVLLRTFAVALITAASCLVLGFPVAYVLAKSRGALQTALLLTVLVPYLTSFLVRSYAWIVMLDDNGVVNRMLQLTGLTDAPVALVYNHIGVYIGMVQIMLPFMILPLYNTMAGIDPRLARAARSMGAGPVRTFVEIFLPLCGPGLRSGFVLVFLLSLGFYITPAMLGGLRDVTLAMLIETQMIQLLNWGFAAAAATILLGVTFGVYILFARLSGAATLFAGHSSSGALRSPARSAAGRTGSTIRHILSGIVGWLDGLPLAPGLSAGVLVATGAMVVFLVLPSVLVVVMSFSDADILKFPPRDFSTRWYQTFFSSQSWMDSTFLSIKLAICSAVLSILLGTSAAVAITRGRGGLMAPLMALSLSPLVVPPIVVGVALYQPFAQFGLIGTSYAMIIGHTIGGVPYLIIIVTAALSTINPSYERAAASMGAGPVRTFFSITLPMIRPAILAAGMFAFIHSFDELVITMLIGGVFMETLPIKMWSDIRNTIDPTIAAVSALLIAVVVLWISVLHLVRTAGRRRPSSS